MTSDQHGALGALPTWLASSVAAALGRAERQDEVVGATGGPAGNARLTAWAGLLLLVLFAAEGVTLIDIHGLISWHVALGALVVPLVALKTATTGWRMLSYYLGSAPYRLAGPPPMLLRVLGPLVVLSSAALLATGVVLVLLGRARSQEDVLALGGVRADWVWLHQASFVVWFAVMTLHVLGRIVPGTRTARGSVRAPRAVPGALVRVAAITLAVAAGVGCALLLVHLDHSWTVRGGFHRPPGA